MKPLISAALLMLSTQAWSAPEQPTAASAQPEAAPNKPAPQLLALERRLFEKQEGRDKGALPPEQYQAFVDQFRLDLESAMSRLAPTTANKGLHAELLSRLGAEDRQAAIAGLTQALEANPDDPELLRAQAQISYESRDYPAAAETAQRAWERSGRKDKAAWGLLKMSEGRIATSGGASSALTQTSSSPQLTTLDWSIPKNNDISPTAMSLVQSAIAARRQGDMAATWSNAQAAMNADPASAAVQSFYTAVKSERAQTQETHAFIQKAVQAMGAGNGEEAVAWARKAYERSPGEDTKSILEDVQRRSTSLKSPPSEASDAKPLKSVNFLGGFLHYLGASATPRRVSFSDIDTSSVRATDFPKVVAELRTPARNERVRISTSRHWSTSGARGLLIGDFTLLLKGTLIHYDDCRWSFEGSLRAFDDKYDFNKGARSRIAEALTTFGRMSPGKPYSLQIRGVRAFSESGIKENCP